MALEALKEKQTLAELAKRYEVHPTMISKWNRTAERQDFLDRARSIFEKPAEAEEKIDPERGVLSSGS